MEQQSLALEEGAGREDIATLATLAGLIVVLMMVLNMVSEFFESIRVMFNLD